MEYLLQIQQAKSDDCLLKSLRCLRKFLLNSRVKPEQDNATHVLKVQKDIITPCKEVGLDVTPQCNQDVISCAKADTDSAIRSEIDVVAQNV